MKKTILPLILLVFLFSFTGCHDNDPKCANVYAVMGKPPADGSTINEPGGLYSGAGICSSSASTFDHAIELNCCYDPEHPDQIKISFKIADILAQQNMHYEMYFKRKQSYSFDADYILSDPNVLSQLGLTTPPRIPANTPSLSLTDDGTTVTFVMPVVM